MSQLRSAILLLVFFFLAWGNPSLADDALPPIDAHRFELKPVQKSTSGKIYLFESNQVIPKTGNLILVYENEKPAMAFRVLKNDLSKKQFVGKRVRRYDQINELKMNQEYMSLEKIADIILPPPAEVAPEPSSTEPTTTTTGQPTTEATPTDTPNNIDPPPANDSTLDSSSTEALDQIDESLDEEGEEEDEALEVEESFKIEPWNNILSVTAGYFGNSSNFSGSPILNNGFSFSYAHAFAHDIFFSKKSLQDSLAVEFGGIYYRIINRDAKNDLYSLLPFYGDLFYQLHFSTSFTLTAYAGLQYNYMTSASNPGKSLKLLQGLQPNFGLGAFYAIGPQWFLRADLGWDRITGGLSIKW